ncbi:hypothetical protein AXF42_Ash011512 [Apostasia shenzhenica]|uniref:Uncharacterized protein n=1 Tax=Apostasia shenzhenica TaxID=1088818 RepID=A0A2I0BAU6_9ASPA|nr:hypothetical protein AXF42_Ash011512 [Apostasia shenzhenica]
MQPNCEINYKSSQLANGLPTFNFTAIEVRTIVKPLNLTAVGKIGLPRPSMNEIRLFFQSLKLKDEFQVSLLDRRHIFLRFSLEEDLNRVRMHGTYYLNKNISLRIWRWDIGFRPGHESPLIPIWVAFPGLPIEFLGGLKSLASEFGKSLHLDKATATFARPSVAKILVEFDARNSYPEEIYISVDGKLGFRQLVLLENRPFYCSYCYKLGHSIDTCYFKHPHLKPDWSKTTTQGRAAPSTGRSTWVEKKSNGDSESPTEPLATEVVNIVASPLARPLSDSVCAHMVDEDIEEAANVLFGEITTKVIEEDNDAPCIQNQEAVSSGLADSHPPTEDCTPSSPLGLLWKVEGKVNGL